MSGKGEYPAGFRFNGDKCPVWYLEILHDLFHPFLNLSVNGIRYGATVAEGRIKAIPVGPGVLYGRNGQLERLARIELGVVNSCGFLAGNGRQAEFAGIE